MLPSELFQAHTAVEYCLPQPVLAPPAFLFVVDLADVGREDLAVRALNPEGTWDSPPPQRGEG